MLDDKTGQTWKVWISKSKRANCIHHESLKPNQVQIKSSQIDYNPGRTTFLIQSEDQKSQERIESNQAKKRSVEIMTDQNKKKVQLSSNVDKTSFLCFFPKIN